MAEIGAEYVADYIVKGFANNAANAMRRLYTRREPQAARGTPERVMLAQARVEMDRVAPGFAGGGLGTPALIAGGATVPLLASAAQFFGGINFLARPVLVTLVAVLVLLFAFTQFGVVERGLGGASAVPVDFGAAVGGAVGGGGAGGRAAAR